jgi:branched-subunit amino acid transport protein
MEMNIWFVVIFSGLITFLIRFSLIGLWGKFRLPDLINRSLKYIPPAVLAAIILPEIMIREGQIDLSLSNPRLVAGLVAIIVAWVTKNVVVTILAGMGVLLLFQVLIK